MGLITIKARKPLHRVEIIRSEEVIDKEIEILESRLHPEPEEVVEEIFEEFVPEEIIEEFPDVDELPALLPEPEFSSYHKILYESEPLGISTEKIPENVIHYDEVQKQLKESYDTGFSDSEQLLVSHFEGVIRSQHERVLNFELIIDKVKEQFLGEVKKLEKTIVPLGIKIAENIIHRELEADPGLVVNQVKKVFETFDNEVVLKIKVNPKDKDLLEEARNSIATEEARLDQVDIVSDEIIPQGGCLLETSSGTIDATIEKQLQKIKRGLADIIIDPDETFKRKSQKPQTPQEGEAQ